ncbi:3-amino-5-hydroxybenzoate synthase [Plantactinospora mayteni]|uniref:3-amino-5-hydroxybenzoate synthase n=1 Tax=Plantactinospora mayteni TaxID=566021 RepID=A0ABQ4EFS1_9ACTN|nr:DegT/DnrJ/EryC1/StrS family aminotransferase [Plantactinospora mayteni]GIG93514.1 3-amino-5-hydroxybenzoate synthase [Plantactinospora mayteni]
MTSAQRIELAVAGASGRRFGDLATRAPWPVHDELERAALDRVLSSGSWSRLGDADWTGGECGLFEREFAGYLDAGNALAVANGTLAIEIGLLALRVRPGDEVIVQAGTFFGSVTPILRVGARPVFVDLDESTCTVDPAAVEAAVGPRTVAVVAVHLAGLPADLDRLAEVCRRHSLALLEDCAQAVGTRWRGRAVGTVGDVGAFSLQQGKVLQSGEGGVLVCRDRAVADRAFALHQGFTMPGSPTPAKHEPAANMRLSSWPAAIARCQLTRVEEQIAHRLRNARAVAALLRPDDPVELVDAHPGMSRWSPFSIPLRIVPERAGELSQELLVAALRAEGVPAFEGHLEPLYDRPIFRDNDFDVRDTGCPVTDRVSRRHVAVLQQFLLGPPDWMPRLVELIRDVHAAAPQLRHAG